MYTNNGVRKRVHLGDPRFVSADDYLRGIEDRQIGLSRHMKEAILVMENNLIRVSTAVVLVFATPVDFGITGDVSLSDFLWEALSRGLHVDLPFETGLMYAFTHGPVPYKERFHVAVKPVTVPPNERYQGFGSCGVFLHENFVSADCFDLGLSISSDFRCAFGATDWL